ELHAQFFQLGDVGLVELGDVRDHRPVAGQVRAGDLLDPRQGPGFDLAELAEVHLRPRQQVEATATGRTPGRSRGRGATGERGLDIALHVFPGDAAATLAAGDLGQVDAQLAREQAHRRGGV